MNRIQVSFYKILFNSETIVVSTHVLKTQIVTKIILICDLKSILVLAFVSIHFSHQSCNSNKMYTLCVKIELNPYNGYHEYVI